ncbi:VOC family protein [Massilia sp. PWRC2]|uniref:VOC family protein n=1 Tax=Massilia sp. PWRC2 TaxID=2804626 RepID=UPI003CFB2616
MPNHQRSTLIPCISYRDAPRAIDWLVAVFGFTPQLVVDGPDGTIAHAQLTLGGGMIMVGSLARDGVYARLMAQPIEIGGRQTQTTCLVVGHVDEVDAVYGRALDAGATLVSDIDDMDYGGRAFACRDREGHVWNVGSYDPWQVPA